MARPYKCRRVEGEPYSDYFKPRGLPLERLEEIRLTVDEFEAVRLADLEELYQEMSRNRDESVLAEIEQILLIASQQLQLAGNVKEAVGKATDNDRLEAEGKAQQVKGTGQDVAGSVKGALGDKI